MTDAREGGVVLLADTKFEAALSCDNCLSRIIIVPVCLITISHCFGRRAPPIL